jgi:hypothetical protein
MPPPPLVVSAPAPSPGVAILSAFSGVVAESRGIWTRLGVLEINDDLADLAAQFRAVLETSDATYPAEARLYDLTAGALVAGSVLSTSSTTPQLLSVIVAPVRAAGRLYEVQTRTTHLGAVAVCSHAGVAFVEVE